MIDTNKLNEFANEFDELFASLGNSINGMSLIQREFNLFSMMNVYHYTDIGGFIGIMKNKELWASHIAFMNDRSEYIHGKELFRKKLTKKLGDVKDGEQTVLQNVLSSLDNEASSDSIFPTTGKDVFSVSFTYSRDSLEMWRGYGKETGIAIGFDWSKCHSVPGMCLIRKEVYQKLLEKYDAKPEQVRPGGSLLFFPVPVMYEDDKKDALVDRAIELGLNCFKKQADISESTAILSASEFLSDLIFKLNPLLKHYGFKGEEECRFVDNFMANHKEEYHIHYRNRGGIILPYVVYKMMDLTCKPLEELPICEIVVGPGLKQEKVVDSIKYFLEKNGMGYLVDKVQASSIPYVEV